MVFSGSATSRQVVDLMPPKTTTTTLTPARPPTSSLVMTQSTMHDFPFPVVRTWGSQKSLVSIKLQGNAGEGQPPAPAGEPAADFDEFEQIRTRLMVHLREAADKVEVTVPPPEEEEEADLPWSLRTRRATSGRQTGTEQRSLRPRPGGMDDCDKQKRRRKFSVELSRDEIEEDVYSLTGRRASRRPKKRPRALKKQLDPLFPGLYLFEITADCYQVAEPPQPKI